jgi:hypothetical protein
MIGGMKVLGADLYATNVSGNNYVSSLQAPVGQNLSFIRLKLHKVVVSNLSAATNVYLWIFDLAAGTAASVAPRVVELCPAGVCTTLDLSTGKPFIKGIYLFLSTTSPANANTAPADAGANAAIMDVDYRLE